jgi:hypothetical protein
VLGTVHATRGIDAVPVCFVLVEGTVAVPVDRVKEKSTTALQRIRNLDADPRATLLCEHWDPEDWSQLWWVRASLRRVHPPSGGSSHLEDALRAKYLPYADQGFAGLLLFRVTETTGWAAH